MFYKWYICQMYISNIYIMFFVYNIVIMYQVPLIKLRLELSHRGDGFLLPTGAYIYIYTTCSYSYVFKVWERCYILSPLELTLSSVLLVRHSCPGSSSCFVSHSGEQNPIFAPQLVLHKTSLGLPRLSSEHTYFNIYRNKYCIGGFYVPNLKYYINLHLIDNNV